MTVEDFTNYTHVEDQDVRKICATFSKIWGPWSRTSNHRGLCQVDDFRNLWRKRFPISLDGDGLNATSEILILASEAIDEL